MKELLSKYKQLVGGTVLGLAIGAMVAVPFSEANDAGTSSDPLVTLSYMELKMSELEARLTKDLQSGTSGTSALFEVVSIPKGTTLYMGESTEFILRVGSAKVVDPNAVGIPDLTDGAKVMNTESVPIDHHMLVPSNDGRGIVVTEDCWIMIKGTYSQIQN